MAQIPKLIVRVRFPSPAPRIKMQVRAFCAKPQPGRRDGSDAIESLHVPSDATISCSS